jgi:hypothetical protein
MPVSQIDAGIPILPGEPVAILRCGPMTGQQRCRYRVSLLIQGKSQQAYFCGGGGEPVAKQDPGGASFPEEGRTIKLGVTHHLRPGHMKKADNLPEK